ncbi:uncharacterized protein MYCFIDRAFT_87291 [Pseudocercospora fijiensis CIRAD86]|uniref:Galactose oxidase n=1 Tax=Pseudocercospora fijiensis (strain CIRAD86) TaxID=383855 RepID=M3AKW7_PSEFD|nr:uncharacterized protein MYCFIDRAFT_87291 [Pseudocercospora fijiensis CIRAD86]EME78107.1 hypothetical protein MYCFIDRAFT_87291 [Pseudocercospora fijiensis CIRAD86]
MAEAGAVAAGGVVAYEAAQTAVEAGVAGYMVGKSTLPLKAQFTQIATAKDDETRLSLARSNHTVTVVKNKAYIFGGETASDKLASNEIHAVTLSHPSHGTPEPDYSVLPAVADVEGQPVPTARTRHAACAFNICVAIFGGLDGKGKLVDTEPKIWLYVTGKSAWECLTAEGTISPAQRSDAKLFDCNNNLVLYGGNDAHGKPLKDVWYYSYTGKQWAALPSAPVSTSNAALNEGVLYLIDGSDHMSSNVHSLHIDPSGEKEATWSTAPFPTNPLTPGPRPRVGGGLLPISTGYGRNYLFYFFGARQDPNTTKTASPKETEDPTQWSDSWTYQIQSSSPEAKPTFSITEAIKPSKIKDVIREKLGFDSGERSWAEVEVLPPGDLVVGEGKVHPGPRAFFGADVVPEKDAVVVWGGLNAKGEREGDGWIIKFSTGLLS